MARPATVMFCVGVFAAIAGAGVSMAKPGPNRAGGPWSIECSISDILPSGVTGSLPRRDRQNGDFLLGVRGNTPVLGFGVGYSASAHFSSRFEFQTWSAQFGGDAFLGTGDSISIGEFDICRARSNTVLLSLRWHADPDLFYEGATKRINVGFGPVVGFTWLDPVSPNAADPAVMGLTSIRGDGGVAWGAVWEVATRFGHSRWVSGLSMSILGGGGTLHIGTSNSSRWRDGTARIHLLRIGALLSYHFR